MRPIVQSIFSPTPMGLFDQGTFALCVPFSSLFVHPFASLCLSSSPPSLPYLLLLLPFPWFPAGWLLWRMREGKRTILSLYGVPQVVLGACKSYPLTSASLTDHQFKSEITTEESCSPPSPPPPPTLPRSVANIRISMEYWTAKDSRR